MHRNVLALSVLLSALATSDAAAQTAGRLQLKDIFALEFASDPQISPDAKRVVYVRNAMDIMKDRRRSTLWSVNVDGSEHRPITTGMRNDVSPRWSPDGTRLAYVAKIDGQAVIMCRWLPGEQEAELARLQSAPGELVWAPDGKSLAFSMHVPEKVEPYVKLPEPPKGAEWADPPREIRKVNYRHDGKGYLKDGYHQLFVLSAEGGTPRQLTGGAFHHAEAPAWTPDGKYLIFSANRNKDWEYEPKETELYELNVADRVIRQLTKRRGPDVEPAVSPDGKLIAYVGLDDRYQGYQVMQLYVMDRDGKSPHVLKDFNRDVHNPRWSSGGGFIQYDDQGVTKIGHVAVDGTLATGPENIGGTTLGRPYSSGSYSVAQNTIAFTITDAQHPADVAVTTWNGAAKGKFAPQREQPRRLTTLNADLFADRQLGQLEEFWFESSHDGRKVEGWILKPPGFDPKQKYPLILEIHGGPFANYGPRFSAEMQLYAAAGYVVLYINPRGSTSYGQEFGNLIHHNYPSEDYDDLMSGVDALVKRGYIDSRNLFVTGGSGGGILTAWIIGRTNRFAAAVIAKPVINWYSFVLSADIYPFFARYWFPGPPWEHAEHYLKRSPISLVGNVTTPSMIITGEVDHRTPMSESEQYYQALKLRKIDTMLVRIPEASHDTDVRPSQMIAKIAYVLQWFERHKR